MGEFRLHPPAHRQRKTLAASRGKDLDESLGSFQHPSRHGAMLSHFSSGEEHACREEFDDCRLKEYRTPRRATPSQGMRSDDDVRDRLRGPCVASSLPINDGCESEYEENADKPDGSADGAAEKSLVPLGRRDDGAP